MHLLSSKVTLTHNFNNNIAAKTYKLIRGVPKWQTEKESCVCPSFKYTHTRARGLYNTCASFLCGLWNLKGIKGTTGLHSLRTTYLVLYHSTRSDIGTFYQSPRSIKSKV